MSFGPITQSLPSAWYHDEEDGVEAKLSVEEGAGEEGVWYVHIDTPHGMISVDAETLVDGIVHLLAREVLR